MLKQQMSLTTIPLTLILFRMHMDYLPLGMKLRKASTSFEAILKKMRILPQVLSYW